MFVICLLRWTKGKGDVIEKLLINAIQLNRSYSLVVQFIFSFFSYRYTYKKGNGKINKWKANLFLVSNLVRNSHRRWFLLRTRQAVRLMCSYQHPIDAPNAMTGHTRRGPILLIVYWAGSSPFGAGKYGCTNFKFSICIKHK